MDLMAMSTSSTGGIPVLEGGAAGEQVQRPGQLQYGPMLLGGGTPAGWRELVGWRDAPEVQTADSPRPQAHGDYAGQVLGNAVTVTFTYLLRGTPEDKQRAVDTIERHTPVDGIERPLVVDDGSGPWLRYARVIGRQVPQALHYRHAPLECAVQFLCADPRRYSLRERVGNVRLPESSGGLEYPLTYPLQYGESSSGAVTAVNNGSVAIPPLVTFYGPLTDPLLITARWRMGFNLTLADGDRLVVDTAEGTALLNGTADRLYTLRATADPLERCVLPPGRTDLSLAASAGTGRIAVTYRDARM